MNSGRDCISILNALCSTISCSIPDVANLMPSLEVTRNFVMWCSFTALRLGVCSRCWWQRNFGACSWVSTRKAFRWTKMLQTCNIPKVQNERLQAIRLIQDLDWKVFNSPTALPHSPRCGVASQARRFSWLIMPPKLAAVLSVFLWTWRPLQFFLLYSEKIWQAFNQY
jgi:hypothetical protein